MDLNYCMECLSKHSGAAIKYLEEAEDFYLRSGELDETVQAKMRATTKEIAGMADDVKANAPDPIKKLYNDFQMVRKEIDQKKLEYGGGTIEDIREARKKLEALRNRLFDIRKTADFYVKPVVEKIKEKALEKKGIVKITPVEQTSNEEGNLRIEQTIETIRKKAEERKEKKGEIFDKLIDHLMFKIMG